MSELTDPEFGSDDFLLIFPVWLAVAANATKMEDGERKMLPCNSEAFGGSIAGGVRCIGVFTDEDLADRYIQALRDIAGFPEGSVVPVPFYDPAQLSSLLAYLHSNGFHSVILDPKGEGNAVTVKETIPRVIESLDHQLPPSE